MKIALLILLWMSVLSALVLGYAIFTAEEAYEDDDGCHPINKNDKK